jgi:transcriptional regulator with XRE-family HTH domain
MLSIEEIRNKLKDRRIAMVAEATGLSRQVIYNLTTGKTPSPAYETVKRLSEYLEKES